MLGGMSSSPFACELKCETASLTFLSKFILGNILLNSILIFQCYDYIKTIDIPNFSVIVDTLQRKFVLGNIMLYSILIFQCNDCIIMIEVTIFL